MFPVITARVFTRITYKLCMAMHDVAFVYKICAYVSLRDVVAETLLACRSH